MSSLHPAVALFSSQKALPVIPSCVHYAGSPKFIKKAFELQQRMNGAFDVVCDLEDGAARGGEANYLKDVLGLVRERGNAAGRVAVRPHDPSDVRFTDEVTVLFGEQLDLAFMTISKCTGAAQLRAVKKELSSIAAAAGRECPPLHVLIETPRALHEVWEIAAVPGVEALELGLLDFISEHNGAIPASAMRTPGQFEHPLIVRAKTEIASAALGNGVVPSHSITIDLRDAVLAESDARTARQRFGFLRMWSIHPAQIEPILRGMEPDFSDLAKACAIMTAAADASWAPIDYEGMLYDRASYRTYCTLLQQARQRGRELPPIIVERFFAEQ